MQRDEGADTASLAHEPGPEAVTMFRPGWRASAALVRGAFRTLVFGQALGQLGDGLTQIAFAQLVVFDIGRGASPGRIAGILAVTLLPFSIVGPLGGVLIDRWDRRRTLIIASLCRASLAAVAIAAAAWRSEVLAYAGVVLLLSSSRFVLDAKGAVLPRTVGTRELVRANAISGLIGMTAAFIGAVGGAMFVSWSVMAGFLAGAGAYVAASACFARLPAVGGGTRTATVAAVVVQLARELRAGVAVIVRTPDLRRPLTAVSLHRLLLGAGFVLLVLVADQRYHLQASGYGLAIAVTGAAAVVGTVSAPWLSGRWPPPVLLPLAFLPPAAAVAVVGYAPSLASLVCAVAVAAVSFQSLKVIADALVGRNSPDEVRGRVFAIYDVLYNVAFVLAGLLMIPLWQLGREQALAWWLASGFFVGWLVMARMTRAWPFRPGRGDPRRGPGSWLRLRRAAPPPVPGRWWMRGAAFLCGAVVVIVFPRPTLWWAAWFVLTPWLIVIRRAPSAREAVVRGWWAAVGFLLAVHYWLLPSTTVFLAVIAALLGLLWLPWAALSWRLLSGELTPRRLAAALAVVPAGWVLVEAARSWSALGGPWGLLGASQWRAPPLLASAALGGVWLVSFLIVAANVAVTALVEAPRWRTKAAAAVMVAAVVAVGPIWFALEPAPRGAATLSVAVVQAGVVPSPALRLSDEIAATDQLPPGRFGLVVWGESSVGFDLLSRPDLQRELEAVAGRVGADLLVNVDAATPTGAIRKTAVLLDAHAVLGTYQKMRLVPFGEYIPMRPLLGWLDSFTQAAAVNRERGKQIVVMRGGNLSFAPLICFESAFPDMSRTAVGRGAQLLVFQSATTTFQGTWAPDQHASLAAVRAAESGRPALQATLSGTTAAFDAQGRRLLWHPAATGTAVVDLPIAAADTPFDRFGDWVPATCIVAVALAVLVISLADARPAGRVDQGSQVDSLPEHAPLGRDGA
jgi:apolipoprotein N-acyltransferase